MSSRPAPNAALLTLRSGSNDIPGVAGVLAMHAWPTIASGGAGVVATTPGALPDAAAPTRAWHLPTAQSIAENAPLCVAGGSALAFASRGGTVLGYAYGTAGVTAGGLPTAPDVTVANWPAEGAVANRRLAACAASADGADVVFLAPTAVMSGVWINGATGALLGNVSNPLLTTARAVAIHSVIPSRMYVLTALVSGLAASGSTPTHVALMSFSGAVHALTLVPGGTLSASPTWLRYDAATEMVAMPLSTAHGTAPGGVARAYTDCDAGQFRFPTTPPSAPPSAIAAAIASPLCRACPRHHYRSSAGQFVTAAEPPLPCDPCDAGKYTTAATGGVNSAVCVACPASPAADTVVEKVAWSLLPSRAAGTTLRGGSLPLGTHLEDTAVPFNLTLDISQLSAVASAAADPRTGWLEVALTCSSATVVLSAASAAQLAVLERIRFVEGAAAGPDSATRRTVIHGLPVDIAALLGPGAAGSARVQPLPEFFGSVTCYVAVRNRLGCASAASVTAAGGTSGAALDADTDDDAWLSDAIVAAFGDATARATGGAAITASMIARAIEGAIDVARITLDITGVNDRPVVAFAPSSTTVTGQSLYTPEDTAIAVPFSVTDPDVPATHAMLVTVTAAQGTVSFPTATEAQVLGFLDGGNGQRRMSFLAVLSVAKSALAALTFAPKADFSGADSVTVTVSDRFDLEPANMATVPRPPALSGTASVAVTVARRDDAPVIRLPATATTREDTAFTVTPPVTFSDADAPFPAPLSVLASVDHGTITLLPAVTGDGGSGGSGGGGGSDGGGYVPIAPDGIGVSRRVSFSTTGRVMGIVYTPDPDWVGSDVLTVTVSDGTGGVGAAATQITVTAVNDAPRVTVDWTGLPTGASAATSTGAVAAVRRGNTDTDSVAVNFDGGLSIDAGGGFDIVDQAEASRARRRFSARAVTTSAQTQLAAVVPGSGGDTALTGGAPAGTGYPLFAGRVTVQDPDAGDQVTVTVRSGSSGRFGVVAAAATTTTTTSPIPTSTVVSPLSSLSSSVSFTGSAADVAPWLARVVYVPPTFSSSAAIANKPSTTTTTTTAAQDDVTLTVVDRSGAASPTAVSVRITTCGPGTRGALRANPASPFDFACEQCAPGGHTPAPGALTCVPCPAGTHAGTAGSKECTACPAGSRSEAARGSPGCTSCGPGSIAAAAGAEVCTACPVDQFAGLPGSTACTACPSGSFTNGTGAAKCTPCVPGASGGAGVVNNGTTTGGNSTTAASAEAAGRTCPVCPAGTREELDPAGFKRCLPCLPGQISGAGSLTCTPCPRGTYGVASGGNTSSDASGGGNTASSSSSSSSSSSAPPTCRACPARTVTVIAGASRVTECACAVGHYGPPGGPCTVCPRGAVCASEDRTHGSETPAAAPGYFLAASSGGTSSSSSLTGGGTDASLYRFEACIPRESCLAGNTCRPGHAGPRCGACAAGYYRILGRCVACSLSGGEPGDRGGEAAYRGFYGLASLPRSPAGAVAMAIAIAALLAAALYGLGSRGSARLLAVLGVVQMMSIAAQAPGPWGEEESGDGELSGIGSIGSGDGGDGGDGGALLAGDDALSAYPSRAGHLLRALMLFPALEPSSLAPACAYGAAIPPRTTPLLSPFVLLLPAVPPLVLFLLSRLPARGGLTAAAGWTMSSYSRSTSSGRAPPRALQWVRAVRNWAAARLFTVATRCAGVVVAASLTIAPGAVTAALAVAACDRRSSGGYTWREGPSLDCFGSGVT